MQPGDLVFYYSPVSHVGIYAGDGKFINAPAVRRRRALPERLPLGVLRRPPPVAPTPARPLPFAAAAVPRSAAARHRRGPGSTPGTAVASRPVARTLLVTNDFPPRTGGIQRYLQALADRLPAGELVVYAPAWPGAAEFDAAPPFPVYRHPTSLMLPVPRRRRAGPCDSPARTARRPCGSAPPPRSPCSGRTCGAAPASERVLASTHGHEVGWSMLPVARQALRRIGRDADVVTVVSPLHPRPVRRRVRADGRAGAPAARASTPTRSGPTRRPARRCAAATASATRRSWRCVSRLVAAQGPGHADPRAAADPRAGAGDAAAAGRRRAGRANGCARLAAALRRRRARGVHRPGAGGASCPRTTPRATCSPCRAAPAAAGWTSRVWASSAGGGGDGLPVVAGRLRRRAGDRARGA